MNNIIIRPLVTEKAMGMQESGQYVFEVHPKANKIEIKKEIERMFEVNVKNVRTVNIKGKVKSRLTRQGYMRGKTPSLKKAYVTLEKGQTIDIVSGEAGS